MRSMRTTLALGTVAVAAFLAACSNTNPNTGNLVTAMSCPLCTVDTKPGTSGTIKALVDFTEVAVGKTVTKKISIVNTGTLPFDIQEVKDDLTPFTTDLACGGSCGQRTVQVGGRLDIGFSVEPTAEGTVGKTVVFQTGAGPLSVRLSAAGVVPKFTCDPPSNLEFGSIVQGTSTTKKITCKNNTKLDAVLVVEKVQDDTNQFSTSSDGKLLVGAGRSVDIPISFSALPLPEDVTTSQNAYGSIRLDNDDGTGFATILAEAIVLRSALQVDPAPMVDKSGNAMPYDFGFVSPGSVGHKAITLRNLGNAPLTITTLAIDGGSDPEFGVSSALTPFVIPGVDPSSPGINEAHIDLSFSPPAGDVGARTGQLNLNSDDPAGQVRFFDLAGFGGGPTLSCAWDGAPGPLEFGATAVNNPRTRNIVCTNVSAYDDPTTIADNLTVLRPYMNNDFSSYQVSIPGDPLRAGYGVGQSFTIQLRYAPQKDSPPEGDGDEVVLKTNDTAHLEYHIAVHGSAELLPACQFNVKPSTGLNFGDVPLHTKLTLEVGLVNTGDGDCLLQDVRISKDSSDAFSLGYTDGSTLVGALPLPKGKEIRIPVAINAANNAAALDGALQFELNVGPGDAKTQEISLHGSSLTPCIVVIPSDTDFGVVAPMCSTRTRQIRAINVCTTSLHVTSIGIAPGVSDDFHVQDLPKLDQPLELKAGNALLFSAVYKPQVEGSATAAIAVTTAEQLDPYVATVHGESNVSATETDVFQQQGKPKVDVLWVLDDSYLGQQFQGTVATYAGAFLQFARDQNIDFHVGVTTFETGLNGGSWCGLPVPKGRLVPINGKTDRIITPDTDDADSKLKSNLIVGECGEDNQGLDAALFAVTPPLSNSADDPRFPEANDGNLGFLRDDASLAFIFTSTGYSYSDEQSPQSVSYYYNVFQALKGFKPNAVTASGMVQTDLDRSQGCNYGYPEQKRYEDLVNKFNGYVGRQCPTDWDAQMRSLEAATFGTHNCFALNNLPEPDATSGVVDQTTILVKLNGNTFPDVGGKGQRNWDYDATKNAICFYPLSMPESGTEINISYHVACL